MGGGCNASHPGPRRRLFVPLFHSVLCFRARDFSAPGALGGLETYEEQTIGLFPFATPSSPFCFPVEVHAQEREGEARQAMPELTTA
ncbi:hypothetical protein ARSEF4850_004053 [Beauveria asiatica]